jgi:putative Ca2+/H+ antiporter (TMEM165/GDT1 family)
MGLLHGGGGSAGVVALILASQSDRVTACVALVVISVFSGLSMMGCSWLMCRGVDRLSQSINVRLVAGVGAVASLAFGAWYCAVALTDVWYPF